MRLTCLLSAGSEEELGSSEESGKDWDELEEEAKKGSVNCSDVLTACLVLGVTLPGPSGVSRSQCNRSPCISCILGDVLCPTGINSVGLAQ